MSKKLFVIRHGRRDSISAGSDTPLNERGQKQAENLKEFLSPRFLKTPQLLSSPKKRCRQTLGPLAEAISCEVEISFLLDECQMKFEDQSLFRRRVLDFLDYFFSLPQQEVVICTHGDWIPVFLEEVEISASNFEMGSWVELEYTEERKFQLKEQGTLEF